MAPNSNIVQLCSGARPRISLDFRKMVHVNGPESSEETWAKVAGVAGSMHKVGRIEVPKIPAGHLNQIVQNMAMSPISRLGKHLTSIYDGSLDAAKLLKIEPRGSLN